MRAKNSELMFVLVLVVAFVTPAAGAQGNVQVKYPEGYRSWAHVKSMVIEEGHPLYESFGGIHHVYANDSARRALIEGKGRYPDGAVFVFDLLEAWTPRTRCGLWPVPVTAAAVSDGELDSDELEHSACRDDDESFAVRVSPLRPGGARTHQG